jgi:hypothetical protein
LRAGFDLQLSGDTVFSDNNILVSSWFVKLGHTSGISTAMQFFVAIRLSANGRKTAAWLGRNGNSQQLTNVSYVWTHRCLVRTNEELDPLRGQGTKRFRHLCNPYSNSKIRVSYRTM